MEDIIEDDIKTLPIVNEENHNENEEQHERAKVMREAAVKKAIIPLEERMTMFTNLLREKEVKKIIFLHNCKLTC